jgi:hypothetical protein
LFEYLGDVRHQRLEPFAELEIRFQHLLKIDRAGLIVALQNEVVVVENLAQLRGESLAVK